MNARRERGRRNEARGRVAEAMACSALQARGWQILAQRRRTAAAEVDLVAERQGLLAVIEVKARASLDDAASCLSVRQQRRLMAAAEILCAENPGWGRAGVRFDLIILDRHDRLRRIKDAFRQE